jgi:hypothetical protein
MRILIFNTTAQKEKELKSDGRVARVGWHCAGQQNKTVPGTITLESRRMLKFPSQQGHSKAKGGNTDDASRSKKETSSEHPTMEITRASSHEAIDETQGVEYSPLPKDESSRQENRGSGPQRRTSKDEWHPDKGSCMASMKRNVSFHKIEIREYQRTLGDNPSVSSGPPMALDWKYNPHHHVLDVDDYEKNKTSRSKIELVMPKSIREDILKQDWDVSRSEMQAMAKEINITKRGRRATAMNSDAAEKRTEVIRSASRKVKRIFSLSKKKEEEKLWENTRTHSGRRIHSMNDLYSSGIPASNSLSFERQAAMDSTEKQLRKGSSSTELSLGWGQECASSLAEMYPDAHDDDGWGFGFDEDA